MLRSPAHSRFQFGVSLTLGLVVFGVGGSAHANGAMGLAGMATLFFALVALVALVLAALLGTAGWVTAMRGPTSVGGIFGRGFLGVSAVICFAIGAVALGGVFDLFSMDGSGLIGPMLAVAVLVFLAVEFVVGATLYGRAHARAPSSLARLLSIVSYGIAGLLVLGALGIGSVALFVGNAPEQASAEVRGYEAGCEANDGSDCNMLGLRLREGTRTLAPDEDAAADAFRKGCDLGTAIACRNAAEHYGKHPERATTEWSEVIYRRRYDELVAADAEH